MGSAKTEIDNLMARNPSLSYEQAEALYRASRLARTSKGGKAVTSKPKGFAANPELAKRAGELGRARRWGKS